MSTHNTTGKRIKKLREGRGFTQAQMADRLGMSPANFSSYERDGSVPPGNVLSSIADILSTNTDYLLCRTDDDSSVTQRHLFDMPPSNLIVSKKLKYLRLAAHKTRDQVMKDIYSTKKEFVDERTYRSIEDYGFRESEKSTLSILADYFGVTIEYLKLEEDVPDLVDFETEGSLTPVVATICAGDGILAVTNIEDYVRYPFPNKQQPDYALRVKGDSMTGAGIDDGDIVYIRKTSSPDYSGQIVAAFIPESEEGTLKRIKFNQDTFSFQLYPENDAYSPISLKPHEVIICGVYIGHFKQDSQIKF
jgi:repressor LexA